MSINEGNILDKIKNNLKSLTNIEIKPMVVLYIILTLVVLGGLIYIYNTYISKLDPNYTPNLEFNNNNLGEDKNNYATMYLLHVKWCPYSKKTLPIWNDVKTKFNNQKINKHILLFKEINGDNEHEINKFEREYLSGKGKIDAFPIIYLVKDNQIVEFEATPTLETLDSFIHTVL